MRVKKICVQNFLSFDDFKLDLDDNLTVIVGPNGSGKSNLVRALGMVRDVVGRQAGRQDLRPDWEKAHRLGGPPGFKVGLELEFEAEDLDLWKLLFEAWLAYVPTVQENPEAFRRFLEGSRPTRLHDRLRQGRLEVEFSGPPGSLWTVRFLGRDLALIRRWNQAVICTRPERADLPSVSVHDLLRSIFSQAGEGTALEAAGGGLEALIHTAEGQGRALALEVHPGSLLSDSTLYREITAEFGPSENRLDFVHVLDRILSRGLLVTDDIRPRPRGAYPADEFRRPVGLEADGGNLDLYLFRLKNGSDPGGVSSFVRFAGTSGNFPGDAPST
jgi:energy-coupling factor transporter ATP-binding protein EcfA2